MADVQDVIRRLILEAQTRGLDKAEADLRKLSSATDQVAKSASVAGQSTTTFEKGLGSTSKSFERTANSIDPVRKQVQMLSRDLTVLEKSRGIGGISDEEIDRLKTLRVQQADFNTQVAKSTPLIAAQAKSIGLSAHEMKNLGFQLNDAATMLASGASPFQVIATQSGQVLQVLQGGGGITANLKDLGSKFVGALTPATVGFAAVAAGAVASAVAVYRYTEAQKELKVSTFGAGRETGATVKELDNLAAQSAKASNISISSAREMTAAYASVGKIGKENFVQLSQVTKDYAATTKQSLPEATKELETLFSGNVVAAFDSLNKRFNVGDDMMRRQIVSLDAAGKEAEAFKVILDGLQKPRVLTPAKEVTSGVQYALNNLKNDADEISDFLAKLWVEPAKAADKYAEKLKEIDAQIKKAQQGYQTGPRPDTGAEPPRTAAQNDPRGIFGAAPREDNSETIKRETAALEEQKRVAQDAAAAASNAAEEVAHGAQRAAAEMGKLAAAQRNATEAGKAVRTTFPEIDAADELLKRYNAIKQALADQAAGVIPAFDTRAMNEANDALAKNAAQYKAITAAAIEAGEAARQSPAEAKRSQKENTFAAEIQGINALTVAQKAAAAGAIALAQAQAAGDDPETARQAQQQASTRVMAEHEAMERKAIQAQDAQLQRFPAIIAAAGESARAQAVATAAAQQEMQIIQEGGDLTSENSKKRIENAKAIAEQNNALQEAVQVREIESQGRQTVDAIKAETVALSMATTERGAYIAKMKYESLAREEEIKGNYDAAEAYRAVGVEVAAATRARDRLKQAIQEADAAEQKAAAENNRIRSEQIAKTKEFQSQKFTSSWFDPEMGNMEANIDRSIGKGVWKAMGYLGNIGAPKGAAKELQQKLIEDAQKSSHQIATQALQNSISIATRALSKQIEQIQEAASEQLSALSDAAQEAGDALSKAADKRQKLEDTLKENEDKRQQRIQNYLAAGPSPFEKNADIFYDPKSRMAFAEQIAGNTDELLVAQLAAAKAQEDAAKDADKNAKAAVKAGEATQKAAEQQVKELQAQQDQLEQQAELLSAGLDIDSGISNNVLALIGVIKNELPGAIGDHMSALMGITGAKAQTDISAAVKDAPLSARYTATGGATGAIVGGVTALGGTPAIGGGGVSLPGYGVGGTSLGIRRYARGGEFTVPGSYSAGDRPFVVGLAGQEKVTVETPAQQAARSRGGGGSGTTIENLIVQMPPATNPIEYLNKRSRPALGRAVRSMARGAGAR